MSIVSGSAGRIERLGRDRMRARLARRTPAEIASLLSDARTPLGTQPAAFGLATHLGEVLGVDPRMLRANDRLDDILRVRSDEVPEVSGREWTASGLKGSIVVCSYDIMHLVETSADQTKWRAKWASLGTPPRNEEAWIDIILSMSVGEFLNFFGEIAKDP